MAPEQGTGLGQSNQWHLTEGEYIESDGRIVAKEGDFVRLEDYDIVPPRFTVQQLHSGTKYEFPGTSADFLSIIKKG